LLLLPFLPSLFSWYLVPFCISYQIFVDELQVLTRWLNLRYFRLFLQSICYLSPFFLNAQFEYSCKI
jgi:hypothetical protein